MAAPVDEIPPATSLEQPWLGLDVGTRRIGIALSNALGIAQPLLTIERGAPREDQRSVLRLARRHGCAGIVVGHPLRLSGEASRQTERVEHFVAELRALTAEQAGRDGDDARPLLPIHLWDERLSTAEVITTWRETHPGSQEPPRGLVDQLAAALILQGWLDASRGAVSLLPPDQ